MKLHTPSVLVGAVVAGAVLLSGGMGKPGPAGGGAPAAATPPASQIRVSDLVRPKSAPSAVYTVRGEVTALPEKGKPQTELMIKHEAIDDFKNKDGKVVGMNSMIMDFPPEKGLDVTVLKVGDKVEVEFAVWWSQSPPWLATKVTKLPADTKLEYRRAGQAKTEVKAEPKPEAKPEAKVETKPAAAAGEVEGKLAPSAKDNLDAIVENGKAGLLRQVLGKMLPGATIESAERDEEYPEEIRVYNVTLMTKGAGGAGGAGGAVGDTSHIVLLTETGTVLLHSRHAETLGHPAELAALIKMKYPEAKIMHTDATVSYEWLVQFKVGKKNFVALMDSGGSFEIAEGDEDEPAQPAAPVKKGPGF